MFYAPAKKSIEISKKSIKISLPWHSFTIPIADRNHDIVRGKFLKPRHPASLGVRKIFFGGSGYYTHNTEGYLAKPESLVVPYQDKTFLQ